MYLHVNNSIFDSPAFVTLLCFGLLESANKGVRLLEMRLAALSAESRHAVIRYCSCRPHFQFSRSISSRESKHYALPADFEARNNARLQEAGFPPIYSNPNTHAKEIAVLGGGLTGLCTAYHLACNIPHAKITLFEKTERVGGWLDSEIVEVDDGEVLFEWGPRSLRPDVTGAGHATQFLVYPKLSRGGRDCTDLLIA